MNTAEPHAKYYKMCLQPEFEEHMASMASQQTNIRWKRKMEKGMMGLPSSHDQTGKKSNLMYRFKMNKSAESSKNSEY